ncbi:MAG: hypothetical protein ACK4GQ_01075 [Candidatus Hadarchaeales archaeon]
MDKGGAHTFPLIVIFGVFLAFLMTVVFVSIYSQQQYARVEDEANHLVETLSKTAFQALASSALASVDLPATLGGSEYSLEVEENAIFVLRIISGRGAGNVYSERTNITLEVENREFKPGGKIFFYGAGEKVVVSASVVQPPTIPFSFPASSNPPPFYYFAKENPREAAGIAAVFFTSAGRENADVFGYSWEDGKLIVQGRVGSDNFVAGVEFDEDTTQVGKVEMAWVVAKVENVFAATENSCPSIENANAEGWVYSPADVLKHLRSRTWVRGSDEQIISVPGDADIHAAAVLTNVSVFPAWRITFENQIIYYRLMPWWEKENDPGFLFQSLPEIYPVI